MRMVNIKKASDHEVKKWLEGSLGLTPYQMSKIYNEELLRRSPFYFYKPDHSKTSLWWRLTILLWMVYVFIVLCVLPLKWLVTGKWGIGARFADKFHRPWAKKLNL